MIKILLVEDDSALGYALEFSLLDEGYEVVKVTSQNEAEEVFNNSFNLILLDVNLPDGSGYDFCKFVRLKSKVPIIFLTALDDEVNIVMGLEIGGNDYLTKPFGFRELQARIKVQLRSMQEERANEKVISEDIVVNIVKTQAFKNNEILNLTALEYKLLILFMNNPLKTMKRDDILVSISKEQEAFFDENTLSVYIKRLREKIEDDPKNPRYILTQRGLGYRWNIEVKTQ
ncbi:response regulator transcription factor [Clostridium weizhouense]|uniref:Stage 0 sporulation protein A homolog n=1 Tax=Clostridium weizhouense TaxID=2859781 RepID=A0ABS7ASF6_9CLOT|nr:response regulator transcription factor [Clostridium weizhouense]MBW6411595.1 response regulator transcription factor [Clostridium weizhouense]